MTGREKSKRIAELNDAFRKTGQGGLIMFTRGVSDWLGANVNALYKVIRDFDEFDPDDDPYGEHDFGAIDFRATPEAHAMRVFWKIEYYDKAQEFGSPDPADPPVTTRVMTIMRAEEY